MYESYSVYSGTQVLKLEALLSGLHTKLFNTLYCSFESTIAQHNNILLDHGILGNIVYKKGLIPRLSINTIKFNCYDAMP